MEKTLDLYHKKEKKIINVNNHLLWGLLVSYLLLKLKKDIKIIEWGLKKVKN